MSITRTPIIDDDGSGKTGTVLDNAWKQEFYNQIDGFAPQATILKKATGSNSATGFVVLMSFVMPPLAVTDAIRVQISFAQRTAPGANSLLLNAIGQTTDTILLRLDDIGGNTMGANQSFMWDIVLRNGLIDNTVFEALAMGGRTTAGSVGAIRLMETTTSANWLNGGWTLAVEDAGQSAGGLQLWSWTILKI